MSSLKQLGQSWPEQSKNVRHFASYDKTESVHTPSERQPSRSVNQVFFFLVAGTELHTVAL